MEKHPRIILLVVLAIGVASVVFARGKGQNNPPSYAPPEAKADIPNESVAEAPDGKLILTMKEEKGKENIIYSFKVTTNADGLWKEIFTSTVPAETTMEIPRNTFSPDGKYVFLKETAFGETHYLVLSTSGTPLTKDGQTLDITGRFGEKYPDYVITEATGWGGVGLIVFNTSKKDGSRGPSFWFEVPSGAFIQLSSQFN